MTSKPDRRIIYVHSIHHIIISYKRGESEIDEATVENEICNNKFNVVMTVPSKAINAFNKEKEPHPTELAKSDLIFEYNDLRKELFIKTTERDQLKARFDNLNFSQQSQLKTDIHWRNM